MSAESVFNKRLTEETKMDKVEGLLEHFSLPPKVIDFIRKYKRSLVVLLVIIAVAVVSLSLYSSYRKKVVDSAASALSLALQAEGEKKAVSLAAVVDTYGNTSSAQWARIELAHFDMGNEEFASAAVKYENELKLVDDESLLYGMLLFGVGQALEGEKKYAEAVGQYDLLKEVTGYEHIGYAGLARTEEAQGNFEKAFTIYNNYLLNVGDDPSAAQARIEIEERIARLKAKM